MVSETEPVAGKRSDVLIGDSVIRRSLGLADVLGTLLALWLASLSAGVTLNVVGVVAVCLIVLAGAKVLRLYDRDPQILHKNTIDEYPKLVGLGTGVALLVSLAGPALADPALGRLEVALVWGVMVGVVPGLRSLARVICRGVAAPERCLYLGNPADAAVLQVHLRATTATRARIVGVIDVRRLRRARDREYQADVAPLALENGADRVILASELAESEDSLDLVRRLRAAHLKVSIVPSVPQLISTPMEIDRLGGSALLGLPAFEATFSTRLVKRSFDIGTAAVAILLALPLLIVTAVAIKVDSSGPVLYRQARAGLRGTPFMMLKFRSMIDGADAQKDSLRTPLHEAGLFKLADDPRITRVGSLLRKLSIDELPQLINVLRGDMSLVGPRPLPLDEDEKIGHWGRQRLEEVRPGMTGPWQVLGGPNRIPLSEMVKLDMQYVASWSLWQDVRIVLMTVGHVFSRRGH